jgi:hypothetical protein
VDRHFGPGPRHFECNNASFGTHQRTWRESERPVAWASWRGPARRTPRHARHELASRALEGSREEPQAIESVQERGAGRLGVLLRLDLSELTLETGLAVVESRQASQDFELTTGRLDPRTIGGGTKKGASIAWIDRRVGSEGVGPADRVGGHGRTARSAWSRRPGD